MPAPSTQEIVDSFTREVTNHLDQTKLDGPVRLDNTHTVVIIPLKDRGPIHAHVQGGINENGVQNILKQIATVPSLKGLLRNS